MKLPIRNLTKKERKRLQKENRLRSDLEVFLDFHNHKMELLRTISSFLGFAFSALVFLKVFNILK